LPSKCRCTSCSRPASRAGMGPSSRLVGKPRNVSCFRSPSASGTEPFKLFHGKSLHQRRGHAHVSRTRHPLPQQDHSSSVHEHVQFQDVLPIRAARHAVGLSCIAIAAPTRVQPIGPAVCPLCRASGLIVQHHPRCLLHRHHVWACGRAIPARRCVLVGRERSSVVMKGV
jgi:hypothetical protein